MTTNTAPEAPSDAFRDVMAAARAQPGRARLANQSMGRPISAAERTLAEALMAVYATGAKGAEAVARGLAERQVAAPLSGRTDWDAALLEAELSALNQAFDAAYAAHGTGA
ncbi:MAG: recombinase-like helix-turn-helix domain-containing protein [Paracoccaceae bacterium]